MNVCQEIKSTLFVIRPLVRACSRVITFPFAHMTDSTQFRNIFLLAFCKGGSFDNP